LDGDNSSAVMLNNFYTADLDSYKTGVVKYKLSKLSEGTHTLTIKAWDVFNNSSEETISFVVNKNLQITITGMNVYPNPFREDVKVEFEINLFDSPVEAYLEVFNINGSLVSSTDTELFLSQGYNAGILTWNGLTASGNPVPPGVYLISIRASSGNSETVKAARLIKMR
jgi:flagellar hook assembly protein FlgD